MNIRIPSFLRRNPSLLYKYRDWKDEHHKNVIFKGQFFLSNPKSFEDKFDCSIPLDFDSIKDKDIRRRYLSYSKSFNPNYSKLDHQRYVEHWFKKGLLRHTDTCREIEQEFFDRFDQQAGVLSLAIKPTLPQMWKKYADNYQGYCIGIDFKHISKETNLFDSYGYVSYKNRLPSISPLTNPRTEYKTWTTQIFAKLKFWAFEEEYRIFKMSFNSPLSDIERIINIPEPYIKEIILGMNMNLEAKAEITDFTKCKYPNARILEAIKKGDIVYLKERKNNR